MVAGVQAVWLTILVDCTLTKHVDYDRDPNLPPLLGKPTVRFRNMVNVLTDDGVNFGVNAQHYAVLVRDLPSYSLGQCVGWSNST